MNQQKTNNLFKVNDVRAVYGKELTAEFVYEIGKAFASYIKSKKIIVGRDMRLSSPKLDGAFIKGVTECGTDVIDIGLIDSPGLYFATAFLKIPGAMITASHNPPEYNGIKMCKPPAIPIGDTNGMSEIKEIAIKGNFTKARNKGKVICKDILKDYVKHILSFANLKDLKPIKVAFDTGNGMGGLIVPKVYENLPLKMTPMYFTLDGRFPNHIPNTAKEENLRDLQNKVIEIKADLGIATDGDADRVAFVDESGKIIDNSIIASIIFDYYFKDSKNKRTIYSSTCSKIFQETANASGGHAFMEKVGHLFIKIRMRKEDAIFGVESTGHFYYKNNFYADSGIITSIIMYDILSKTGKKLSELAKPYSKYHKAEEVSLKVKDRDKMVGEVEAFYKSKSPRSINHMDGLIMDFGDYWFSVKPANTEPLLRINIEATSNKKLLAKQKELIDFIKKKDKNN
jgi:phosphomannomutase